MGKMQVILKQVLRTLAAARWLIVNYIVLDPTICRSSDPPSQKYQPDNAGVFPSEEEEED